MNDLRPHEKIELVPVDSINVLNPRARNRAQHKEIIESIRLVGLKRPITISRLRSKNGENRYNLICGQGRLEAFIVLGQREIPAFIFDATEEECLVMSLVENVARRQHSPLELLREVGNLRGRGHSTQDISEKIGMSVFLGT